MSEASFRIPLSVPHMEGNELRYLAECVRTNYVSSVGPFVGQFEREFAAFLGVPHAVACANGTAALHLAMRLVGVEPGDEVFVSTLTFVASINAIRYQGATPVLVDAEEATWNLDPGLVVSEIERRARRGTALPKAVEVVHILGHPAHAEPIAEVCRRHGIPVVEDAAEALGATYSEGPWAGRPAGSIGTIGCFSFNGNKIITSGGGGMLVAGDAAATGRARHLSTQAKEPRIEGESWHDEIAYNYRLTNISAALGLAQLECLPGFLARKREIARRYDEGLADLPGVGLPPRAPWAAPSFWLYTIRIDPWRFGRSRQEVRQALASRGIESRAIWVPAHLMAPYQGLPVLGGGVAERLFAEALSLPSSVGLTPEDQARVIRAIRELVP